MGDVEWRCQKIISIYLIDSNKIYFLYQLLKYRLMYFTIYVCFEDMFRIISIRILYFNNMEERGRSKYVYFNFCTNSK